MIQLTLNGVNITHSLLKICQLPYLFFVCDHDDNSPEKPETIGEVVYDLEKLFFSENGYFEGDIELTKTTSGSINLRIAARAVPQITLRWTAGYIKYEEISDVFRYANAQIDGFESNARTPLMNTASRNQAPAVKTLLHAKADPEVCDKSHGLTALHYAGIYGQAEAANQLIAGNAKVDSKDPHNRTPLSFAAKCGFAKCVHALIDQRADIESKDNDGLTPLMLAAIEGQCESAEALIQRGAQLHSKNNTGLTSIMLAAVSNRPKVAQVLVRAKADVEERETHGLTPLMIASMRGYSGVVDALIDVKANTEAIDSQGRTALMFAAHAGKNEVIKVFATKDSNLLAIDSNGRNAVRIAKDNGFVETAALLKEWIKKTKAEERVDVYQ